MFFLQANLILPETPRSVGTPDELPTQEEHDNNEEVPDDIPKKKPAILESEGTSMKVSFAERPPKKTLPKTLRRKYRGGLLSFFV